MSQRGFVLLLLVSCLAMTSLEGQIRFPGQNPYPGSGGPIPGGSGGGNPRSGKNDDSSKSNRKNKDAPLPTVTTTGMLRMVSGSQFVLEADDHRIITYKTNGSTKVEKDGKSVELKELASGDHLTIDATSDDEGFFTAVGVTFNLAGTAADREAAARTWDLPALNSKSSGSTSTASDSTRDHDDDGRPILRRKPDPNGSDSTGGSPSGTAKNNVNSPSVSAQNGTVTANGADASQAPENAADDRPTTMIRPSDPAPDADDPGKPALRRGRPISRPRPVAIDPDPAPAPVTTASAATPSIGPPSSRADDGRNVNPPAVIAIEEDPVIRKAKAAAQEYASTLPNFFCRQVTTRYETDHPKEGWQALDIVTADLAYENGAESYKNIKIGSKAVNSSMDEIPGTRSTGEFASILEDLFAPDTAATFRKSGQDTLRGRSATTYKFEVKRENSHWRIIAAAQLYYPAFRGTVWIDRETARVLRIEMESRNMPLLFPFDKVESATDYDFVRLASPQQFLMPVNAEVLSCEQGSSRCLRNRIEFRNYRKFGAESDITFDN